MLLSVSVAVQLKLNKTEVCVSVAVMKGARNVTVKNITLTHQKACD